MDSVINQQSRPREMFPDINESIARWTDYEQRMEIARAQGVTSPDHVRRVLKGKCKNHSLRAKLIEKAEENKRHYERAQQLEQIQQRPAA
jgi:hypothetical protein